MLSHIIVPKEKRKQGIGTKVMQEIVKYADQHNFRIRLTPDNSIGGTSVSRLKSFYKRFDFVENKGRNKNFRFNETMYRNPKNLNVVAQYLLKKSNV